MMRWHCCGRLFNVPDPLLFGSCGKAKTIATTSLIERATNLNFWPIVAAYFTSETFQQTTRCRRWPTNNFDVLCTVSQLYALAGWMRRRIIEVWWEPSNIEIWIRCIICCRTLLVVILIIPLRRWDDVIDCNWKYLLSVYTSTSWVIKIKSP